MQIESRALWLTVTGDEAHHDHEPESAQNDQRHHGQVDQQVTHMALEAIGVQCEPGVVKGADAVKEGKKGSWPHPLDLCKAPIEQECPHQFDPYNHQEEAANEPHHA